MTRSRILALSTLTAAILIVISGCGSDDSTSSSSESAKADFIVQADRICTQTGIDVSAEAQKRFPSGAAPGEGNAIEKFFAEVTIPALDAQYERLGELTPPPGDEEQVAAIMKAGNKAVAAAEKDPSSLNVLTGFKTPFDEVNALEQDYGFKVCGADDPDPDAG